MSSASWKVAKEKRSVEVGGLDAHLYLSACLEQGLQDLCGLDLICIPALLLLYFANSNYCSQEGQAREQK